MTTPIPTGRLTATDEGYDLVFERSVPGAPDDAWATLTEPERTARWIGPWDGAAGVGRTVRLRMGFEDDAPQADVDILACEPPRRLRVRSGDDSGTWEVSVEVSGGAEHSRIRFVMHRVDPEAVEYVGPGWEYYLDQFVAALTDGPLPRFADYDPAQRAYFRAQADAAR